MATNPPSGDGHRNGAVKGRSQTFNPKTEQWIKRDSETGRFMDVKRWTCCFNCNGQLAGLDHSR